jgi:hypothetical protein
LRSAQLYSGTKTSPIDTVDAYKWYFIVSAQLSQITKKLKKHITTDELTQVEQMAEDWLSKSSKIPSASIRTMSERKRTGPTDAVAD